MSLLESDSFPHTCDVYASGRDDDGLLGGDESRTLVSSGVACWEQTLPPVEIMEFAKMGMRVNRKVYFLTDPEITEEHDIVIVSRLGVAVPVADRTFLDVATRSGPGASAGLGVLYKVMAFEDTGAS